DECRSAIGAVARENSLAAANLKDLPWAGDGAAKRVGIGAVEGEQFVVGRITPGIRRIAAERDVAKDAAGCAAAAEDYRSAVDAGTTGIGCVSGDRQGSAPVFDQWAVSDRSVGEERGIGQRIVVGKAELQDRRLREIARDIVEAEDTTAEGADGKHI